MLEVCWKLPQTVVGTLVTALVAGVVLVAVKLLSEKLRRYLPLPIPGELLTVRGQAGRARLHPCPGRPPGRPWEGAQVSGGPQQKAPLSLPPPLIASLSCRNCVCLSPY